MAAIAIIPTPKTVLSAVTGTLTAAQVQALVAAVNPTVSFSGGYVQSVHLTLSFHLEPTGSYTVTFYQTAPTT